MLIRPPQFIFSKDKLSFQENTHIRHTPQQTPHPPPPLLGGQQKSHISGEGGPKEGTFCGVGKWPLKSKTKVPSIGEGIHIFWNYMIKITMTDTI